MRRLHLITPTYPTFTVSSGTRVVTLNEAAEQMAGGTYPLGPSAPTGLTATVANASSVLAWTAPTNTNGYSITNHLVEYTPSGGSAVQLLTGSTTATYTLTGLTNGTSYSVRVAAITFRLGSFSSVATATPVSFVPMAVLLTSGTSYTIPSGASTMKAWAVGGGGGSINNSNGAQAGGVAYKTWNVASFNGQSVSYVAGQFPTAAPSNDYNFTNGYNSTVTFNGTTITGIGGARSGSSAAGGFSGGDGGATGGMPVNYLATYGANGRGGAVGGNAAAVASCGRQPMSDVSGLIAALQRAGVTTSETCAATAAFGSGGYQGKFDNKTPGIGGGRGGVVPSVGSYTGTNGAVVLYFT